ncbi:hypothetical protein QCA50_018576 [Cerrena zonata]|uniref:Uncharacterized protein n=1 Tax=Cerrena zonata TaxID=2478898 RepID=A0AAW0FAZ4_9APHY
MKAVYSHISNLSRAIYWTSSPVSVDSNLSGLPTLHRTRLALRHLVSWLQPTLCRSAAGVPSKSARRSHDHYLLTPV